MDLKEAYRTRTTQNRTWIYVAGIMGLGVAAASGALAAATAVAAGTLALLAISGGAAAASFATIDNTQLANVYNMAANQIGTALASAEAQMIRDPKDCATALATLVIAVSDARNTLEIARTDSAAGALVRAQAGLKMITEVTAAQQAANPTQVILHGAITAINDTTAGRVSVSAGNPVTLTVKNTQLENVPPKEIKVALGSAELEMTDPFPTKKSAFEYTVTVKVPSKRPDGNEKIDGDEMVYIPFLIVGKSQPRIPISAGSGLELGVRP